MDILFSAHIKNTGQDNVVKAILELLSNQKNKPVVFLKEDKYPNTVPKEYQSIHELKQLPDNKYDLILAYNKVGLEQIKAFAGKSGTPVIYMVNASDIEKEYLDDTSKFSRIILLGPLQDFPQALLHKEVMVPLKLPVPICKANSFGFKDKKRPKILIDIEHRNIQYSPLYRIAPLLNTLPNFGIKILSSQALPKIFNSHIGILDRDKSDVEKLIDESDIVIGSGNGIRQAISLCKPCIVVGAGGYGGIITPEIFELQNKNGFQGRVGSYLNEHLPEKLILEDILDLLEWGNERVDRIVQANRQLLKRRNDLAQKQLNSLIEKVIKEHQLLNGQIEQVGLKLSGAFSIAPFSKEKFILTNIQTQQVHSQIEKEEAEIINLFKQGRTVKDARMKSGYEEEPEVFNGFVRELVNEKILLVHGN